MIWQHGILPLLGRVYWATTQDGPTHSARRSWSILANTGDKPPFTLVLSDADHPQGHVLGHHATLSDAQQAVNRDRIARLQPDITCRG